MMLFTFWLAAMAAGAVTALAIHFALPQLQILGAVDHENTRSGHKGKIPNAGGVILLTVTLFLWAFTDTLPPWPVAAGLVLLMAVSTLDDLWPQGVLIRLGAQAIAVTLGLWGLATAGILSTDGWIAAPWLAFLAFGWLWFINAFNFMDGADGLAGSETAFVLTGLLAMGIAETGTALVLIGAVLGFLWWNRSPAKIFLGDGGSVPIGYLLGFWLVAGINGPHWAAAMILPAYFCWDATFTVFHRWRRGENLTQGHRGHAYQQAIDRIGSDIPMIKAVTGVNIGLLALALLSPGYELPALLAAAVLVFSLIRWMKFGSPFAWLPL